jgi:hypothetical protein
MKGKTVATHTLVIRVLSEDGEVLATDNDFREDACYDFFDTVLKCSSRGEVVQLIDTFDDRVMAEQIAGQ